MKPRQGLLFPEIKRKSAKRVRRFDEANRESARILLSDPVRYAGLPIEWAKQIASQTFKKRNGEEHRCD